MNTYEKMIQLFEEQLDYLKQQNKNLTKQNHELLSQIESLTEQVRQLTNMIFGSRSEKSKYQASDGQLSLWEREPSSNEPEQTEEKSTENVTYTVTRSTKKKKRNDSFMK